MRKPHLQSYTTLQSRGPVTNKKGFYLHVYNSHDGGAPHQSHVTLWLSTHVANKKRYISTVTKPMASKLKKMVGQDERTIPTKSCDTLITTNKKYYTFNFRRFMDTKLSRVVTQHKGHRPTKSRDNLIMRSRDKSKIFYLYFHKEQGPHLSRVVTRMRRPHLICHLTPQLRRHVTTIK